MEVPAQHKEALYKRYLTDAQIRTWVDTVARAITSGGYAIEEAEDGASPANREQIAGLLTQASSDYFLLLVRACLTDLLVFGEAFMEIVTKAGKPFSLHRLDCITTSYTLDEQRKISGYLQSLYHAGTIQFQPEEVVRWWFPDLEDHQKALSPLHSIGNDKTDAVPDKRFLFNVCDPVKQVFFEKFNYRVLVQGLGITDWRVTCRYSD